MRLFQGIVPIRIYKGITFESLYFYIRTSLEAPSDKECPICDKVLFATRSIIPSNHETAGKVSEPYLAG